jgi:hypothetical protein
MWYTGVFYVDYDDHILKMNIVTMSHM